MGRNTSAVTTTVRFPGDVEPAEQSVVEVTHYRAKIGRDESGAQLHGDRYMVTWCDGEPFAETVALEVWTTDAGWIGHGHFVSLGQRVASFDAGMFEAPRLPTIIAGMLEAAPWYTGQPEPGEPAEDSSCVLYIAAAVHEAQERLQAFRDGMAEVMPN